MKIGALLQKLNTTTTNIQKELKEEILAVISTGRKETKNVLIVDKIIAQIKNFHEFNHGVNLPSTPAGHNSNHDDFAKFLIKW